MTLADLLPTEVLLAAIEKGTRDALRAHLTGENLRHHLGGGLELIATTLKPVLRDAAARLVQDQDFGRGVTEVARAAYLEGVRRGCEEAGYTAGKAIAKGANLAQRVTLIAEGEPR